MIFINGVITKEKKTTERLLFIDVLKTIAIIGVLIIHFTPKAFTEYDVYSPYYIFSVFISCSVRFCVPVFIMCSGALFLNDRKTVSAKSIFTKYIPRILVALLLFATVYECIDIYCSHLDTGVWDLAFLEKGKENILTFNTHFHLYYLYVMILIYAFTPAIKTFLKSAQKKDIEYVIIFLFITSILLPYLRNFHPLDKYFGGMTIQYSLNLTYTLLTYFLLGHYLNKYPLTKSKLYVFAALGVLSAFITFFFTTARLTSLGFLSEIYLQGTSPTVFFMAIAVFSVAKNLSENLCESSVLAKICIFISKASFTIYLVHEAFNILFERNDFTLLSFCPYLSLPALLISNFALSSAVYVILSKIPYIKKIL